MSSKKKVSYFYDGDIAAIYFGQKHPMKPARLAMTHSLVLGYGLDQLMEIYRPHKALPSEMAQYHSADYIEFLNRITPNSAQKYTKEMQRYNIGSDCPVFDNLFEFCRIYAGGTIDAANRLGSMQTDIAINWSGGLHHAKKCEASGFCYVNDLVLGILELLKKYARVLYVDIDVHHGDGVEEAFLLTDRVMTVSFHKFGQMFFPGTGSLKDMGEKTGKYYAVNVPLKDGIDDANYHELFQPIVSKVIEVFQPGAIVLQCGADSLAGDRIGNFNLSIQGHGRCVEYVKSFNIPLLVTGGGGYTKTNVALCWAYETGVLVGKNLPKKLPQNNYMEFYAPKYELEILHPHPVDNMNTKQQLQKLRTTIFENLRHIIHAPSVQMNEVPPDSYIPEYDEDTEDPDVRITRHMKDKMISKGNEYFEDEKDHDK